MKVQKQYTYRNGMTIGEWELYKALATLAIYMENTLWLNQRCASCGATNNLTMGYAAGNEVVYCPTCKREEEQR